MKKHLIISDMDGTLGGLDHNVSETTKQVIRDLLDEGHLFYIATGRMKALIAQVAQDIDPRVRIVGSNGGIMETENGFVIEPMDDDTTTRIYHIAQKREIPALFFTDKDILYTNFVPEFFVEPNSFNQDAIVKQIESEQDLKDFTIINALFMAHHLEHPESHLHPIREILLDELEVNVTSSNPGNLEIYAKSVSKGNAVTKLMKKHNIDPEHVIVFGDGFNDVSMFQVAKTSVAMENAPEGVKKHATHITGTNTENGVVEFLLNYLK